VSRARAARAAALVLAAAGIACTKTTAPSAGARFLQPEDLAVFVGRTIQDPVNVQPYLVVANATRNDLSLVDGVTDVPVPAPIPLQTLVVPVANRPSRLAVASLGDDPDPAHRQKADLLVAVSGGDSVLQLVETWTSANAVHSNTQTDCAPQQCPPLAVDLGHDVIALAAIPPDPSAPGTARIAAALADQRVAVVTYARGNDGESITFVAKNVSAAPLGFQPLDIAAMPDDPDTAGLQTALYVATRDEVAPGVFGAAEISLDLSTVRALGARAPTRLVAAARLQERFQPDPATASAADLARSAASDGSAFSGQPRVPRVYAVLDESGCGTSKPIDCGVVALDPTVPSGTQAIPADYAGLMPYRAPMRFPSGRVLRIAASGPPAVAPPHVDPEPSFTADFMRIYMGGTIARATTGAAAVAMDTGFVYFLDLGRFEVGTTAPVVQAMGTGWPVPRYVNDQRLWLESLKDPPQFAPDANPASEASDAGATSAYITVTPGITTDESFTVTWQGILAPDLALRAAEAGELTPGNPWIALQVGDGGQLGSSRIPNDVVQLWRPDFAIHPKTSAPLPETPGDILVIRAKGMPAGCVGTNPARS